MAYPGATKQQSSLAEYLQRLRLGHITGSRKDGDDSDNESFLTAHEDDDTTLEQSFSRYAARGVGRGQVEGTDERDDDDESYDEGGSKEGEDDEEEDEEEEDEEEEDDDDEGHAEDNIDELSGRYRRASSPQLTLKWETVPDNAWGTESRVSHNNATMMMRAIMQIDQKVDRTDQKVDRILKNQSQAYIQAGRKSGKGSSKKRTAAAGGYAAPPTAPAMKRGTNEEKKDIDDLVATHSNLLLDYLRRALDEAGLKLKEFTQRSKNSSAEANKFRKWLVRAMEETVAGVVRDDDDDSLMPEEIVLVAMQPFVDTTMDLLFTVLCRLNKQVAQDSPSTLRKRTSTTAFGTRGGGGGGGGGIGGSGNTGGGDSGTVSTPHTTPNRRSSSKRSRSTIGGTSSGVNLSSDAAAEALFAPRRLGSPSTEMSITPRQARPAPGSSLSPAAQAAQAALAGGMRTAAQPGQAAAQLSSLQATTGGRFALPPRPVAASPTPPGGGGNTIRGSPSTRGVRGSRGTARGTPRGTVRSSLGGPRAESRPSSTGSPSRPPWH